MLLDPGDDAAGAPPDRDDDVFRLSHGHDFGRPPCQYWTHVEFPLSRPRRQLEILCEPDS